ncbi:MAG TPA: peptide ABC transporter [Synergistaceae bacterium]|jgi:peptide/nickel transport system permease protein|nr:peptide ABC transporter [Synergistaceae bacterium]
MVLYILRRLFQSVWVLVGVTVLVFALVQLIPGGPALMILGEDATAEQITLVNQRLGLDRPLHVQYLDWLGKVVRGDFGVSFQDSRPILPDLLNRMPATLELLVVAMFFSLIIALPIGIISAVKPNSLLDNVGRVLALLGVSMPSFWIGLLLIMVFARNLGWFPAVGRESWTSVIMPAFALGVSMAGILMRMIRSSLLEVLREDYLKTARAKGLTEKVVVLKHAMRNAILPVITTIALQVGNLLGGSVVIETVFAWPGMGRFCYMRMLQRDIPTIMGNLMLYAVFVCILNIVTDLLYAYFDPRIRYSG